MKFQRKSGLAFGGMMLSNMCAVFALVFYVLAHPGAAVPRWIPVSMVCFFVLTFMGWWIIVRRFSRRLASEETPEEGRQRRARATKGLKAGLVLYILILLNGIRLVVERAISWKYSIPGLTVDLLLIMVFLTSLRRLKKFELNDQATRRQIPQQ
jgi:threonine/homoserine/homoserine lactone efflux protein